MFFDIAQRKQLSKSQLEDMHSLRAWMFKDKKAWDVEVKDNLEIDCFDSDEAYYMLIYANKNSNVIGCWRILETTGTYMLKDTFPELLHGKKAPEGKNIWELSRFIVRSGSQCGAGFSSLTMAAIRELVAFAISKNVDRLVTVTTVGVERMLSRTGMTMNRFGPALQIGIERSVALDIHLDDQSRLALFGQATAA